MIKYNCGGRGLPVGIKLQVQRLVNVLQLSSGLQQLDIELLDRSARTVSCINNAETVLSPFLDLRGVGEVNWSGTTIGDDLARRLTASMHRI